MHAAWVHVLTFDEEQSCRLQTGKGLTEIEEWTITDDIAGVDIGGVDSDRVIDSGFKL